MSPGPETLHGGGVPTEGRPGVPDPQVTAALIRGPRDAAAALPVGVVTAQNPVAPAGGNA